MANLGVVIVQPAGAVLDGVTLALRCLARARAPAGQASLGSHPVWLILYSGLLTFVVPIPSVLSARSSMLFDRIKDGKQEV